MSKSQSYFSIVPAGLEDIPALIRICVKCSSHDPATRLKAYAHRSHSDPDGQEYVGEMMRAPLERWMSHPERYRVLKVVESKQRQIVGYICWGFHAVKSSDIDPLECRSRYPLETQHHNSHSALKTESDTQSCGTQHLTTKKPVSEFEDICSADMKSWMAKLMPESSPIMFIGSITVDPEYQGRGVGAALLDIGTSKAESLGIGIWVHASDHPGALKSFTKAGFREIGKLEVDLNAYEDSDGDRGGRKTYTYMLREPQKGS